MRRSLACALAAVAATSVLVVRGEAQRADPPEHRMLRAEAAGTRQFEVCATGRVRTESRATLDGITLHDRLEDGRPLSFQQEPAIVTAEHRGVVRFRNFLVAGDVGTLRFKLGDPDSEEIETWERQGTQTVNGRLVSVFEPQWDSAALARVLRRRSWGFDSPMLYWGEILPDGVEEGDGYFLRLRFASTRIPDSSIERLAPDVQYASHVVNIVNPTFGEARLGRDEHGFNWPAVTRKFYEHFQDSYDTLAVSMQDVQVSNSSAFHLNVRNEVRGIGEEIFDRSAQYGSSRLRSVEFYYGSYSTANRTTAHEIAHQWGSYFDWDRIARGIARGGHQPGSHDPLLAEGPTLIGSILDGTRQVRRTAAGWEIERTPGEIGFHPLTRYAMGILPRGSVPGLTLFNTQDQFDGNRTPDPGTAVSGATQDITISHIAAVMGERVGPVDTEWHRAVIVVSRELLTQREMSYWNFFAQRGEDPNGSGVVSFDGFGSFDAATGRAIDLKQDIRPLNGRQIVQPLPVDFPELAPDDFRDVRFDAPVPTEYRVGRSVQWTGRVTAGDRNDHVQVLMRFWKYGGTTDNAILVRGSISSAGSFSLDREFRDGEQGRYTVEVFLFWPGAPAQYPRVIAGPVTIR
jgi:hypothetical protein